MIVMILTEADNDKRLIWELLGRELALNIYNKHEQSCIGLVCLNVTIFSIFGSILSIIRTVLGMFQKVHLNICNNNSWVW